MSGEADVTRRGGFVLIGPVLALAAIGCAKHGPEQVARQYEERRVAGDVAQLPPMLTAQDQHAISSGATLSDAGISDAGIPSANFDSAHVLSRAGDTAVVAAYLTAPNVKSLIAGAFQSVLSGKAFDTSRAAIQKMAASAPRVTVIDTVTMVQAGADWKISLRIESRRAAAEASKKLHQAYRDDDFSAAVNAAKQLASAEKAAPGSVDKDDLAKANDAIQAAALADSIQAELAVTEGSIGSWIRGTIKNNSGQRIEDVTIKVTDSRNQTRNVTVNRLAPGQQKPLFTMAADLASGRPARTEVVWINLGAWQPRISF